jgi:hypothetical protein
MTKLDYRQLTYHSSSGVGTDAGGRAMDVTPAVFAIAPRSMNAADCAGWAACLRAAASFARQIWKLAVETVHRGRMQRCSCRFANAEASGYARPFLSMLEIPACPCPAPYC